MGLAVSCQTATGPSRTRGQRRATALSGLRCQALGSNRCFPERKARTAATSARTPPLLRVPLFHCELCRRPAPRIYVYLLTCNLITNCEERASRKEQARDNAAALRASRLSGGAMLCCSRKRITALEFALAQPIIYLTQRCKLGEDISCQGK